MSAAAAPKRHSKTKTLMFLQDKFGRVLVFEWTAVRLVSSPAALLALRSLVTLSIDCFLATDCGSTRTHLRNQPLEILRRERAARRELNCRTASKRLKIVRRRRRQRRLRNQDKFRRPSVGRSGMARRRTEGKAEGALPCRFPLASGQVSRVSPRIASEEEEGAVRCVPPPSPLVSSLLHARTLSCSSLPYPGCATSLSSCLSGLTPPARIRKGGRGKKPHYGSSRVYRCDKRHIVQPQMQPQMFDQIQSNFSDKITN